MSTSMAQDTAGVRRAVEESNRRFADAFTRGDAAGAAREFYTVDARILPPGSEMVQGREAIVQFWTETARQTGVQRVELSTVDLELLGDRAVEIGRVTLTLGDGQQATAKYVVIWKQEDGRWRGHLDIWNMDSA